MTLSPVGHGYASGCDCVATSIVNASDENDDGLSLIVALCERVNGSATGASDAGYMRMIRH